MPEFRFDPNKPTPSVGALLVGPKRSIKLQLVFDTGCSITEIDSQIMSRAGFTEELKISDVSVSGVGGMSTAKHKGVGPQSLTANELREGLNVWLTPAFDWSTDYKDALLTEDVDVIAKMKVVGERDSESNLVVGVYFIDVEPDTGLPVRYREKFRVTGPTHDQSHYPQYARQS